MSVGRSIFSLIKWLAGCVGNFVLWTTWLALCATLVVLIIIASSHELGVPTRVIQMFRDRLAVAGLRVTLDSASFDLTGNLLVKNLKVYADSFEEPLATCPSIFLRIDPWALTVGTLQIDSIVGHQLSLFVPPMLSPTGNSEPVISDVEFAIEPSTNGLSIRRLVGHAGKLAISGHGNIERIRTSVTQRKESPALALTMLAHYLHFAGQVAYWKTKLEPFEDPTLHLLLTPDSVQGTQAQVTFSTRAVELTPSDLKVLGSQKFIKLRDLRLSTTVPTSIPAVLNWTVNTNVSSIDLSDGTVVHGLAFKVFGQNQLKPAKFSVHSVRAAAGEVMAQGVTVRGVNVTADIATWPSLTAQISARVTDEDWGLSVQGNPQKGSVTVSAAGDISSALIDLVDAKIHRNFAELLTVPEPATVTLQATTDEGWKLKHATAHLDARNVVARDVALIRAAGDIDYDGHDLSAKNIILVQGGNKAAGNYWMDTKTLDYRFLLTGMLRPNGIDGWFHDWWPRFWSRFDFSQSPPVADIDVQGRWGAPHLSNIYIHVETEHPQIRDVSFDLVRMSLFIRPDFYDAPEVYAKRGKGEARGRFTRSVDLDEGDFRWMEFQVQTNLQLQETAKIFGDDGSDIVEPFVFAQLPNVSISGRLEGDMSPNGPHQSVDIGVDSTGEFHFFDFPLTDLRCEATVRDRVITVSNLRVGFADGIATGHALVSGKEPDRHLKLDADLRGANLGLAIHLLEQYGAHAKGQSTSGASLFQERLAKGKLDVTATAEGGYHNLLSFTGGGHAELHNGEIGQINLLGSLSAALRRNSVLGFTSWNLDTARADFTLDRDKLLLPTFQLTGPTAKIDGHGTFSLAAKTIEVSAKFYPFEEGKTLLANAVGFVLNPVSAALELKLSGSLSKPKWFFEYGPTNLLRKIVGADKPEPAAPSPPPLETAPRDLTPPPFLRR